VLAPVAADPWLKNFSGLSEMAGAVSNLRMIEDDSTQFVIPQEKEPSYLRRLFRRTLYLRLLDGEFILWCFETGRMIRRASDLLRQQRIVVSDTQAFAKELLEAMNDVGVGSTPFCRRLLVLHCLRQEQYDLTETEKYALYEMWKKFGRDFFVIPSDQTKKQTSSSIVEICYETGAFMPQLKRA